MYFDIYLKFQYFAADVDAEAYLRKLITMQTRDVIAATSQCHQSVGAPGYTCIAGIPVSAWVVCVYRNE